MADADYTIMLREAIQRKGAAAYAHGRSRDSHGFNHTASAITDFHAGYDTAAMDAGVLELAQGA